MKKLKFTPMSKMVLVEPSAAQDKVGAILLPEQAKKKPANGKVIAVAWDVDEVSVADVVYYNQYSGTEITLDGKDYIVMSEEDILGVLE